MDHRFPSVLLLLSLSGTFGRFVYVKEEKIWLAAQLYCLQSFTDLAPVSTKHHIDELMALAGSSNRMAWVGMFRNVIDREQWTWCGGATVSRFFWAPGEPKSGYLGAIWNSSLYAVYNTPRPFFCYSAFVVRERKTWEEAWGYCRELHRSLASVASEAEMLLLQRELGKEDTTEHVWVGLHFFPGDGWLWTDNEPLDYEAWGPGGKPACPRARMECVALKMNGWSSGAGSAPTNADVQENVWDAHDCEEKLHFICY